MPSFVFPVLAKGAYHLAKKSGNFGLKSNGKVIFRKIRSEIFPFVTDVGNFLPICFSFKDLRAVLVVVQYGSLMVSAISSGWSEY